MSVKITYDETIETNDIKVPFVPGIITPKIEKPMRNGRYEGGERAALREILCAGDRVLEFGSGIGMISSVAAMVEGVEAVTTVEANPELIPVIEETHRINATSNIELLNGVVVVSQKKRTPFYVRSNFWSSSLEPDSRPYKKKKHLPCYNIQRLIEKKNPTVIVCDIEGGELGLFDQADLSGVRAVILEMHPKVYGDENVEAITHVLENKGLVFVKPLKASSVRRFERDNDIPVVTPAPSISGGQLINPDLTELN
jgi:FkbM family methyltransferase